MNLYQTKFFTTLQKQYKNQFGVDISQFVKLTNSSINFEQFEEKHLTVKQKNVTKNIQKNKNKKIILSGGIASGVVNMASSTWNFFTNSGNSGENKAGGSPQDNNIGGP